MIKKEQLRCGIYDSTVAKRNISRTPERTAQCYELEIYHCDSGISHLDGATYPIRRGMLLCARPGQVRYSQLPIRSSYIWVTPDADTQAVLNALPPCTYLEGPQAVEALLRLHTRLQQTLLTPAPEPERTVGANGLFLELLHMCMRLIRGDIKRPMAGRLVQEAYQYMDRHFSENCTLEQIAAHVHVTANHLHTAFVESEGITPYEYVLQKRIERAKTLICIGKHSLAQVALETGFCSQSHFTAAFKKSTGQTPARYRKTIFDIPK